jgi:hypothetical protein
MISLSCKVGRGEHKLQLADGGGQKEVKTRIGPRFLEDKPPRDSCPFLPLCPNTSSAGLSLQKKEFRDHLHRPEQLGTGKGLNHHGALSM